MSGPGQEAKDLRKPRQKETKFVVISSSSFAKVIGGQLDSRTCTWGRARFERELARTTMSCIQVHLNDVIVSQDLCMLQMAVFCWIEVHSGLGAKAWGTATAVWSCFWHGFWVLQPPQARTTLCWGRSKVRQTITHANASTVSMPLTGLLFILL